MKRVIKYIDLNKKIIFVTKDVNFEEKIFPFREKLTSLTMGENRMLMFFEEEDMQDPTLESNVEVFHNNDEYTLEHPTTFFAG